ncbi:MAG: glycosyltransferase family 1 protein [Burkholderiales bacterium]
MRISYVTETFPPEVNGVALTAARMVAYLRAAGHEVEVIRPSQQGESRGAAAGEWLCAGFPIPMYPDLRFGLARPATLAKRFAQTRPQLVHVVTEGPLGRAAVAAAARLSIPTTSDFRTNFHQYSRYYRLGWLAPLIGRYLRNLHNRTARTFAPTRRLQQELTQQGFERVEWVGRGVDAARFSPDKHDQALRLKWGAQDGPVLLYVGRLAPEKNVDLALAAWRRAHELVPSARMVVVGDGPLKTRLAREFPEVLFAGMKTGDALAAYYASADLFVFPSLSETFGNVTLEALASGLPVVAFDAAAASEFVVNRVNGRLIAPGDDAAFVVATGLLASLHGELAPMRVAAREAALSADWPAALARFEAQLMEIADATEPRRSAAARVASVG